ncbi:Sulfite efflux pump SSU1 [Termitomyces sp. J132]|nr:Sulfite efflux pump SSU1 [Termitomyces sp. J132]
MLRHPTQSLYASCFPMAITTLINVSVDLINVRDPRFLYFLWAIWWIDVFISVLCCWGLVHIMSTLHTHSLSQMTPIWLLPVVTLTVASSTGAIISLPLAHHSPSHALLTTITSISLLAIGLTLALIIITIYIHRLIVHGLPPGPKILSVFLPLGPTAQSGIAVLLIGQNLRSLIPLQAVGSSDFWGSRTTAETVYVLCVCMSFILWSLAVMCILFALLAIYHTLIVRKTRVKFALTFWGLVFPNGVFANLTIHLSKTFDSGFLRVLGSVYAIATFAVWIFVAVQTVSVVCDGSIFDEDLDDIEQGAKRGRSESREPLLGNEALVEYQ